MQQAGVRTSACTVKQRLLEDGLFQAGQRSRNKNMEDRLAFSLFGASRNRTVQRGEGGVLQSVLHHANSKTPCYHSCEGLLPIQGSWLTILPWRTQPQIKTKTPSESNFSQPSKQLPVSSSATGQASWCIPSPLLLAFCLVSWQTRFLHRCRSLPVNRLLRSPAKPHVF